MGWYVRTRKDTNAQGPFSHEQMQELIADGRVRPQMWFSEDQEFWEQHPAALFGPAEAPPEAPGPAERLPKRSAAPWLAAGVTCILLLFAVHLDQWATSRLAVSRAGFNVTAAVHFGRTHTTVAIDVAERARAVGVQSRAYADLRDRSDEIVRPMYDKTLRYGSLLLWLSVIACLVRLAGAFLIWRERRFAGTAAGVYILGTAFVASVFVVALLFNDGGILGPISVATAKWTVAGADVTGQGFGFSAWVAMLALIVDAMGILSTKVALTPRRRPPPRGRRRVIR